MPRIKSAKKKAIQSEKRRKVNTARKSAIKSAVKDVMTAVESNDMHAAQNAMKEAEAKLARAKSKGIIHRNAAARKISRLAKRVAKIKKSQKQTGA